MGNTLLRDLSVYCCMFHVALIFVMLFRSRFSRKNVDSDKPEWSGSV